ncbi:MAG: GntR family transcriptional regulator [Novosphingobium sp.]|nr:GntR family transcriptional regulator [Novosphingobium sp.]
MVSASAGVTNAAFGLLGGLQGKIDDSRIDMLGGKAGRICSEIERRLARGAYRFGEAISTNELVEEFGASRAPVVTALNHLRSAGYLNIIPQVGCRVIAPSAREVDDFFCLFGKVEGAMAGFAAARHDAGEIAALRRIVAHIEEETSNNDRGTGESVIDSIWLFHESIWTIARSPMEARRVGAYWRMAEFFAFNEGKGDGGKPPSRANAERRAIIDAIAERQVEESERLMERYVRSRPFSVER